MATAISPPSGAAPQGEAPGEALDDNPLLREWENQFGMAGEFCKQTDIEKINWGLTHMRENGLQTLGRLHLMRANLADKYAWGIPTDEAIREIAKFSPIVEIGAGTGYWAGLLAKAGADVLAYDLYPPTGPRRKNEFHANRPFLYHQVTKGGPWKVIKQSHRALFLCWPPYGGKPGKMAASCLAKYSGKIVIYVGEGYGGCTANDDFHDLLRTDFRTVAVISIPQWFGIHDKVMIFERR